jgi:glycosyltransferase involved in cell wall biosynthesis
VRPAVYYPWVYLKGGAERVLLELIHRSRHEWTLYTNHYEPEATFPQFAGVPMVQLPGVSVNRRIPDVARAALRLLTQRFDVSRHDGLMVLSEGLGNLLAARSGVPTSCICLTPLKVAYDETTRAMFFRRRLRPHYRVALAAYKQVERPYWRRYVRVFCNSGEVRRRLIAARLVEPSRTEVAYHGVDADRYRPDGRREPFFLLPGRIMWQKNVELAIGAWHLFKPSPGANAFRLVIAGMLDAKSRPYLEQMRVDARGRDDIVFVTSPTDAELLDLYQRSWATVFPAASEDWGLVPLESMACGKPVLATDRGGPKESVVEGRTGFLRPANPVAFAGALRMLAGMPAAQMHAMSGAARERALQFPWRRFVQRIDDHVELLGLLHETTRGGAPVRTAFRLAGAAASLGVQ